MPRQARIDIPWALHHIICRGIEVGDIFCDARDLLEGSIVPLEFY
jgi:putative transposase